ncbi:4Fe-4S binding protein [Limisalsivibrio acetivorans]|uniref:4Fe-4S binding protein n=1 Tax=Limisalsivibrio acetivorans TaxID=1304888 RepID=UPI0003B4C233|nr:4Fe-4S binding protein [Limisalsivibrio acetivorans]
MFRTSWDRRLIQLLFALVSVYAGVRFAFYLNNLKLGELDVTKPGGVEAYLPISAFMGLKQLVTTGSYDFIHPAGLTLLITFLAVSFVFRRGFCGYICPIGLLSECVSSAGMSRRLTKWISIPLSSIKYLILGYFLFVISSMSARSIDAFLSSPYNIVADAKMLHFFTNPSVTTGVVILVLAFLTLIVRNFWCRFLCPYGALMAIPGIISPMRIVRDEMSCTNCRKCTAVCPGGISVHEKSTVLHPDCIGCHDCLRVRDNERCLKMVPKDVSYRHVGLLIIAMVTVFIISAMVAGLWESRVPIEVYRSWLMRLGEISH